jgi:hypothetical protein
MEKPMSSDNGRYTCESITTRKTIAEIGRQGRDMLILLGGEHVFLLRTLLFWPHSGRIMTPTMGG